jgi:MFS family permease
VSRRHPQRGTGLPHRRLLPGKQAPIQVENDYTITADNKLYCDRKGIRQGIQSVFGIGAILGVMLANFISDYRGRKFSMLLSQACMVLSLVLLLAGSYFDAVPLFYIAEILCGYGAASMFSITYVFIEKMMSKKWADRGIIYINLLSYSISNAAYAQRSASSSSAATPTGSSSRSGSCWSPSP